MLGIKMMNLAQAKKNKLFDCPLITFQRVGRSVGIFFFFFFFTFKYWMLKLCSIWTDSYNSTSLHHPPGCSATWTRFTSLPEHVESRKYVHYQVWGRRVFGPSVTSIAKPNSLGDTIAFSVKQWKQRIDCVFFSYKILMKKISQNHKINFFSLIF